MQMQLFGNLILVTAKMLSLDSGYYLRILGSIQAEAICSLTGI
jgi:hypothetical protein